MEKRITPKDKLSITDDAVPKIDRDVYVYFDKDAKVRAPVDAKGLISRLDAA